MPKKSRIDARPPRLSESDGGQAPGALHHVIGRGIEYRKIFLDDTDRNKILDRLGDIVTETRIACYAWALIANHFHMLLRAGMTSISNVMRCLLIPLILSGTLWSFLQNRYKSILCRIFSDRRTKII